MNYDAEELAMLSGMDPVVPPETWPYDTPPDKPPDDHGSTWTPVRPGGKTPGAVPFRPERWDFDRQLYKVASGDTLVGLASTYLLDGARWKELWNNQPQAYRWNNSPDKIGVGQVWPMGKEATDRARSYLKTVPPGEKPPPGGVEDKPRKMWPWVLGGTVAAALGVGAIWYASE